METKQIKYTTDNRKVIVVGKLNSQETIVQEIFISNDVELPSGENFVVKSLHDAPVVSWKEAELVRLEARYKKDSEAWEQSSRNMRAKYESIEAELSSRFKYASMVINKLSPDVFKSLEMFLLNKVKWIVKTSYTPELLEWKDEKVMGNTRYDEGLRLISLFGRDNGTMSYKLHEYSDGSGFGGSKIVPFDNYEDAFDYFREMLLKSGVNDTSIKTAKQYDIEFPKEQLIEYYQKRIINTQSAIDSYKKSYESSSAILSECHCEISRLTQDKDSQ